jgi:hypothetical protein
MIPQYILEDFGFTPANLQQVDEIGGKPLYSSDRLRSKYNQAIASQSIINPVAGKIAYLVERGIIVPCYASKNIFQYLKHTLTGTPANKSIMGFYSPEKNKVYILFDNRLRFMSWANNEDLSLVTIHELMHYVAKNSKKTFYNIFKEDLINYYGEFYKDFADTELSRKELELLIVGAIKMFEWEKDVSVNTVEKYKKYLYKVINLNPEQKTLVIDVPLENARTFWLNPDLFMSRAKANREANRLVFALLRAYKVFNISKPHTFPIQEILFPSEVIAISSEKPQTNHYKAIKFIG